MNKGNGTGPADGDDEDVGYRKPPRRTQWKPGKSGNPRGRPRLAFGKHHLPDVILQRAREIFIEEGNRTMAIREGPNVIKLTAYQASVRAAHISAAKGSAMAQRTVIQERVRHEADIARTMREVYDATLKYKLECEFERERCRRAGLPAPSFAIDPDHLLLDHEALLVEYHGPLSAKLKGNVEERTRCRDEWGEDFQFCKECYERNGRSAAALVITLQSQRNYDVINELLPPGHRKPLPGRVGAQEVADAIENDRKKG